VGQCRRGNAGLYYENEREFTATLDTLLGNPLLAAKLGRNGLAYYERYYNWSVIEREYLTMFERLGAEQHRSAMERLPGWFARRHRVLPPAADVVAALPTGPVPQEAHA
jgi:hypothetical protein